MEGERPREPNTHGEQPPSEGEPPGEPLCAFPVPWIGGSLLGWNWSGLVGTKVPPTIHGRIFR
jgi:hypothetical protein